MLRINILHADKCPKCELIIWTQTDTSIKNSRPNLNCQCWCGETVIKNKKTVSGGGGQFTTGELKKMIEDAHSYIEFFEINMNGRT